MMHENHPLPSMLVQPATFTPPGTLPATPGTEPRQPAAAGMTLSEGSLETWDRIVLLGGGTLFGLVLGCNATLLVLLGWREQPVLVALAALAVSLFPWPFYLAKRRVNRPAAG